MFVRLEVWPKGTVKMSLTPEEMNTVIHSALEYAAHLHEYGASRTLLWAIY